MVDTTVGHERELRECWQAAHLQLHNAEAEALRLARASIDARLNQMNELRSQIASERALYVERAWYDKEHGALREAMDLRLRILENANSNILGRFWMGVALLGAVITVILHFWK